LDGAKRIQIGPRNAGEHEPLGGGGTGGVRAGELFAGAEFVYADEAGMTAGKKFTVSLPFVDHFFTVCLLEVDWLLFGV